MPREHVKHIRHLTIRAAPFIKQDRRPAFPFGTPRSWFNGYRMIKAFWPSKIVKFTVFLGALEYPYLPEAPAVPKWEIISRHIQLRHVYLSVDSKAAFLAGVKDLEEEMESRSVVFWGSVGGEVDGLVKEDVDVFARRYVRLLRRLVPLIEA